MLLTPRTYALSQVSDKHRPVSSNCLFSGQTSPSWSSAAVAEALHVRKMLLVHQAGSVKVGEVVRYTITYTPADDRILPAPPSLYVKIKNTSPIPLRAAWVHGPYNLDVSVRPSGFRINEKLQDPERVGVPQFESNLKAGSSWGAELVVPEDIREAAGQGRLSGASVSDEKSVTWIIDIASQIIFSASAAVHFELLVARDEKALELGLTGSPAARPGKVEDHQRGKGRKEGRHTAQPRGIYSKAVSLVVDDTTSLWDPPNVPEWTDRGVDRGRPRYSEDGQESRWSGVRRSVDVDEGHVKRKKPKRVHLVLLTHGLHSNTSGDMLFLKESIDAAAKQARQDAKERRARYKAKQSRTEASTDEDPDTAVSNDPGSQENNEEESDDEEVVVRGFSGNVVRTERGIKYLGKRLAKAVLEMTYPDQPFLPIKKSTAKNITRTLTGHSNKNSGDGPPAHSNSTIHRSESHMKRLPYTITKISFVGHSLGGLTQTYAIAYIKKHSPHFFDTIKPVNFVALASPFLGLSNENPIYVKFALDFGLVGRTGQDLGLTWRPPTVVRSGWSAFVGGIGAGAHNMHDHEDPRAKPLLRILPTGPAHQVLKMFRNRTVYSNVVNDGIVPLRTSCLLFLDWRSLGRVEKARRENGLVGTMAGWGWAELTGAVATPQRSGSPWNERARSTTQLDDDTDSPSRGPGSRHGTDIPEPAHNATNEDNSNNHKLTPAKPGSQHASNGDDEIQRSQTQSPFSNFLNFLRPKPSEPSSPSVFNQTARRSSRMVQRSQVVAGSGSQGSEDGGTSLKLDTSAAREGSEDSMPSASVTSPPTTSFFESASDLLRPPLPPLEFLIDPSSRPRTIFHDRVYHSEDIPPPPVKHKGTSFSRSLESPVGRETDDQGSSESHQNTHVGSMKVEEKIARAYHRDLSWRKVLVRLEPDAHNNIVVRRMFSNAYGWPVIQHLVDTHFSDTIAARTADALEPPQDRAGNTVDEAGRETEAQKNRAQRTHSEAREAEDQVHALPSPAAVSSSASGSTVRPRSGVRRNDSEDSVAWSDGDFDTDDDDEDDDEGNPRNRPLAGFFGSPPSKQRHDEEHKDRVEAKIADSLTLSPQRTGSSGLGLPSALKQGPSSADPGEQDDRGMLKPDKRAMPRVEPVSAGKGTEDLTQLGLRKGVDESIGSLPLPRVATGETSTRSPDGLKHEQRGA